MSLTDYLSAQLARMRALASQRRRNQIGPGVRNWQRGRSRYTGADLRAIRAERGVGRPPKLRGLFAQFTPAQQEDALAYRGPENSGPTGYAAAVALHGSQRKAAAALGISLGKLQRELRKEAA